MCISVKVKVEKPGSKLDQGCFQMKSKRVLSQKLKEIVNFFVTHQRKGYKVEWSICVNNPSYIANSSFLVRMIKHS